MDVILTNGEERTWRPLSAKIYECTECGSRRFKRSKLGRNWYCKDCWYNHEKERPWWPTIECSAHGRQIRQNNEEDTYWCDECEEEAFKHAYPTRL